MTCSIHHHNTAFFGLAKNDHDVNSNITHKKDWTFPSINDIMEHSKSVKHLLQATTPQEPMPGDSAATSDSAQTTIEGSGSRRRIHYENNICV